MIDGRIVELGRVGVMEGAADTRLLTTLLGDGFVPVIASIGTARGDSAEMIFFWVSWTATFRDSLPSFKSFMSEVAAVAAVFASAELAAASAAFAAASEAFESAATAALRASVIC